MITARAPHRHDVVGPGSCDACAGAKDAPIAALVTLVQRERWPDKPKP